MFFESFLSLFFCLLVVFFVLYKARSIEKSVSSTLNTELDLFPKFIEEKIRGMGFPDKEVYLSLRKDVRFLQDQLTNTLAEIEKTKNIQEEEKTIRSSEERFYIKSLLESQESLENLYRIVLRKGETLRNHEKRLLFCEKQLQSKGKK